MRQALLQTGAEHQTILAAQIASLQASLNALARGQISISLSGPLVGHFAPRVKAPPLLFPFLLFYFPSFHPPPPPLLKTIRPSACLLLDCYLLGRSRYGPAFPLPNPKPPPVSAGPPAYTLFNARTVADVWREWEEGILGGPAVKNLEETWGSRWRPSGKARTAWCRRKVILDELLAAQARGLSPGDAVAALEARRAGRHLHKLVIELTWWRQLTTHPQKSRGGGPEGRGLTGLN